jgi:hypothetical protein
MEKRTASDSVNLSLRIFGISAVILGLIQVTESFPIGWLYSLNEFLVIRLESERPFTAL